MKWQFERLSNVGAALFPSADCHWNSTSCCPWCHWSLCLKPCVDSRPNCFHMKSLYHYQRRISSTDWTKLPRRSEPAPALQLLREAGVVMRPAIHQTQSGDAYTKPLGDIWCPYTPRSCPSSQERPLRILASLLPVLSPGWMYPSNHGLLPRC